jgi:hypothetical protein
VTRRIVIEEPCEHDNVRCPIFGPPNKRGIMTACPGGSRTVLSEPTEEMVERAAMAHAEASGFISPPDDGHDAMRAALTAALFSSDAGGREETE